MTRTSLALSHEGHWGDALTHLSIDYAHTVNGRLPEGLIGGLEGKITKSQGFVNSTLNSLRFAGDWEDSFEALGAHVLTVGFEVTHDHLTDPISNGLSLSIPQPGHKPPKVFNEDDWLKGHRDTSTSQTNVALYVEDHWKPIERLDIVPTLRFDHNSASGNNVSPGLSFSFDLGQHWRMKGGVARAYKAPNLYQSNPNYMLFSASNGCPLDYNGQSGCFLFGNKHIKPETSVNKEIGIEYSNSGYLASLTLFRNDYRNKIVAGTTRLNPSSAEYWALRWTNAKKALVQGLEGNVTLSLLKSLKWTTNLTYMDKFVNKDTGNPLSIIPQFTLNTMLDWHVAPKWDLNLTVTQFGKRKARRFVENKMENEQPIFKLSHHDVKAYAIASVSASYQIVPQAKLRLGIYNLFDKRISRSPDVSSAQTFNQPGRAFYAHLQLTY